MAGDPVMVTSFLATWVKERALLPWERTPGLGKGSADAQKGGEHPVGTALGGGISQASVEVLQRKAQAGFNGLCGA